MFSTFFYAFLKKKIFKKMRHHIASTVTRSLAISYNKQEMYNFEKVEENIVAVKPNNIPDY